MNLLNEHIRHLVEQRGHDWRVHRNTITVPIGATGRAQRIELHREGDDYVLSSVILDRNAVTASSSRWRDLARQTWQWNAEQEVVTFCFDDEDQLIAQVRHPAEFLDPVELELYVRALAHASDRLEYVLTGADVY